jgi:ABC-type multidrug transport system ATPase subunit
VSDQPILSVQSLTKRYGRQTVLESVSWDLEAGTIVALLGANGSGKTTTFKCVLGMTDFRGNVEVAGSSAAKSGKSVRRLVGYLPQTPGFATDDTCMEALRFLADLRRVSHQSLGPLLERVNLSAQRDMRVRELSGGMKQRLALAAALLSDPPLLLLDEPTANLDFQSRRELHELMTQLRDEGRTIVLSTHFVEHIADIADRVILLDNGRVALDELTSNLVGTEKNRDFTVHLNGTPSPAFIGALLGAGIGEDRITPARPDLQQAIDRALAAKAAREEALP